MKLEPHLTIPKGTKIFMKTDSAMNEFWKIKREISKNSFGKQSILTRIHVF